MERVKTAQFMTDQSAKNERQREQTLLSTVDSTAYKPAVLSSLPPLLTQQ